MQDDQLGQVDAPTSDTKRFVFPKWANLLLPALVLAAVGGGLYSAVLVPYMLGPTNLNVGYGPKQPIDYSHAVHVGELGIDCRYCHTTVDDASFAAIPPTSTCWNCHGKTDGVGPGIQWTSEKMQPLKEAFDTQKPIEWVKVHDLADYAYFNHAAHVNAGVSCVQCHGRVEKMEVVYQVENLSMSWCLDCHRNPEDKIWPRGQVTNLGWSPATATPEEKREMERLRSTLKSTQQMTDCSTCHR